MTHHRLAALALAAALVAGACSNASRPEFGETTLPPTTSGDTDVATPTTVATTTTAAVIIHPPAPNGRTYPAVPTTQGAAAERLFQVEGRIHTLDADDELFADVAHEQQMLYRTIGRHPDWIPALLADAPPEYAPIIEQHLAARRSIAGIGFGSNSGPPMNVPAWEIIEPLPVDELRALYDQAEEATGIDWAFLAAINLLETGFGRIDGLSTAGAQGPMQFLPTTFDEVSDGDIRDPLDAIPAAARYLVRRGGPDDMHKALFGYNNSDSYVAAITHYANLFRDDERSLVATHSWEIHYSADVADLWLPVGYRRDEPQPAVDYIVDAPWSAPPASS